MNAHFLDEYLIPCGFKAVTGYDCLGCGAQRAFVALLSGALGESWRLYPPLILLIATFIFTLLHLKFKFEKGAVIIKCLFIATVIAMLVNYLVKMIF
jgi:hypothetical protein